ncbi:MAG: ABC transporter ATP-binding protein [Gemmatimonadaceae bacterium]|nr:ABC transporter ATP-binding protein [Gemmatimonadaceae bacterium]
MIEARNLHKSFGRLSVLRGVDIDIPRGEVTAIIGPNASGKTTFNKMVLGLVRPDAGELRLDGRRIEGDAGYRARVGYMPQAARYPDNLTAANVFAMLTDLRGGRVERDDELIDTLALAPVLHAPMRHLSGGTRQRINAALAFLFSPDVLILDEPTAALDPVSSSTLKDKIRRVRDQGRTVLVTSHVLSEVEELADHVVFLLDGGVRFSGRPRALMAEAGEPTLERAAARLMRDHRPVMRVEAP